MQSLSNLKFYELELLLSNKIYPLLITLAFTLFMLGVKHPPLKIIDLVYFGSNSIEELKESESFILNS
jgi:hypothetical protein